ncbi:hypothetical protein RRG08_006353 [Elysia crispata]|uniref:C-type lectin domain-containing protein n=1 Tax=Elysia crispata TaxID=231223 RepID=A0AAE0Z9N3_9GAST|nr:hypothetical protein RRG08_006353 [Elysia crispata]
MWCSELHVARRGVIMALLLWLVFIFNSQECSDSTDRENHGRLGPLVECYRECAVRFPDSCQSIVYTTDNQSCTPGSAAFRPLRERRHVYTRDSLKYLKDQTWIGLNDLDDEDTYVWENGEPLSDQMAQWVFRPGYPNGYTGSNDEDCAEARHRTWPGIYGLNDAICLQPFVPPVPLRDPDSLLYGSYQAKTEI